MHPRVVCAVFALFLPLGVALDWEMEPLGPPPAGYSQPNVMDINDGGQVVGTVWDSQFRQHVFVWEDGNWTILPTMGGWAMFAWGINNRGDVVGSGYTDDLICEVYEGRQYCNQAWRGFVWEDGQLVELGYAGFESNAAGINNAGTVAGSYYDASGWVPALWDAAGRVIPLATSLEGSVDALAINSRGQVVGYARNCGDSHARLWDRNRGLIDLGTLGGSYSVAHAINDWGMVVGGSDTDEVVSCETNQWGTFCTYVWAPFVWEDGVMTRLPVLGGDTAQAADVNNDGVIAGATETDETYCQTYGSRTYCYHNRHAVVWLDGEVIDLSPGGKYAYANGINNNNEVAGWMDGVGPVIWRPAEPLE